MNPATAISYATVTEQPGQAATFDQLTMMAARYRWAASHAAEKDVLEVACGSGTGLGALAAIARQVEAGDIDRTNRAAAQAAYARFSNVQIRELDALDLPYPDQSFDLVLLFEAIYYLRDASRFFSEARRVLRPGGRLLLATVNRQWTGFQPSPFHVRYYSAAELEQAVAGSGFSVALFTGFPEHRSAFGGAIALLRRAAVALHLMPRTMAGKAFLKRLFYGKLRPIPARLDVDAYPSTRMLPLSQTSSLERQRVLYAIATRES